MPVLASMVTIDEGTGAHNRPVQITLPDILLLQRMIGIGWA